jgi:RNA polymerase sigma-70 factor, ECF subfamily
VDDVEEHELIRRCRRKEAAAFEPLVLAHQDQALRIATALLGDADDAADAVQDAFVKAYRSMKRLRDGSAFGPWFRTILRNGCRDMLRSPVRRRVAITEERVGSTSMDGVERADLAGAVRKALRSLSPEHREILVMKEIEGLSYAEIVEATGIPEGTVASRLYHARQALKRILIQRGITMEEVA